jgi:frataxin-like iron-binding protein CyaY
VNHEEFAERAERRLKEVADRLEVEGKDLRIAGEASKITARPGA